MPTNHDIVEYYQFSKIDYQLYNGSMSSISMHYGLWDESTKSHKAALLNENKILADIAHIRAQDNVIDFGCGYGISAAWLAANRGCDVTGITIDPTQVAFAQELAQKRGIAHKLNFTTEDFHHTTFPNDTFTVVFAIESISHSEDKLQVLKEAYRILQPNGRVVISDGFYAKSPRALTQAEAVIAEKCFKGVHVPPVATKEEFESYIKQAGFRSVTFYDTTAQILPTAKRVNRIGRIIYPLSILLKPLHVKALQTSHMEAFINQYYAFRDGIGVYGVFHAEK